MSKFRILVMKPMLDAREDEAVLRVLHSNWLISGPECEAFEHEFEEHVGGYAVTVSSATAGMHLVLEALELPRYDYTGEPKDPILVPALTHIATADAARMAHRVTLCDVGEDLLLKVPPLGNAAAFLPVDLYGRLWSPPANIPKRPIIVDAAHSIGEWTLDDRDPRITAFVFSFHAMKNMTTGEGGMVVTRDANLAREVRLLREHGQDRTAPGRPFVRFGFKYNMPDILAAIGRAQLKKLPWWMARRRELANRYDDMIANVPAEAPYIGAVPRDDHSSPRLSTPHLYVVRVKDRDGVQARMAEQGIQTLVHYKSLSVDGPYATERGACPAAEKAGDEVLTLPLWPGMIEKEQDDVVIALEKAVRG